MSTAAQRSDSPQSVTRVIQILEVLCASPSPLGLAELSRVLDTPKSSLAALLRGLVAASFVTQADNVYRLGPGAFGLGSALIEARRRIQSSDLVRAGMRTLAERSAETVLYAVRDRDAETLTYVDIIESHSAMRFAVAVGDRRPLYCTSGGRVLLALGPQDELTRYLKQLKPERFTSSTEINKGRLATAIAAVRQTGVAQTIDQTLEGVTGIASAVRDASGAVLGALVVAAPSTRLRDRGVRLKRLVLEEAEEISRNLGYRRVDLSIATSR
jgi:DNA-binding IclR family transcriptional regulator